MPRVYSGEQPALTASASTSARIRSSSAPSACTSRGSPGGGTGDRGRTEWTPSGRGGSDGGEGSAGTAAVVGAGDSILGGASAAVVTGAGAAPAGGFGGGSPVLVTAAPPASGRGEAASRGE